MARELQKTDSNGYNDDRVIVPMADIYETQNEYVITADVPGVEKDGIDITLDNNELAIHAPVSEMYQKADDIKYREYTLYNYRRVFTVGNDIDNKKITAAMNNGVLTITLPKKEEAKPKKIEISVN